MDIWLALVLLGTLLLTGCGSAARVGTLRTESQSVELGDTKPVRVVIDFGAGDLEVTGGAENLLDANFTYNVARLKPQVEYKNSTLSVQQPEAKGPPALQGITGFRNEWDLRLYDGVPMDLSVDMGAGNSELQLAELSLTNLYVNLGAGISTVDLSGDWDHDLTANINTGAADITVRLPKEVGVRVMVESGPSIIDASGLTKSGDAYINAAYGTSDVTLQVNMQPGIGLINLEVEEETAATQD